MSLLNSIVKILKLKGVYTYEVSRQIGEACKPFYSLGWGDKDIVEFIANLDKNLGLYGILDAIDKKQIELFHQIEPKKVDSIDTEPCTPPIPIVVDKPVEKFIEPIDKELRKRLFLIWLKSQYSGEEKV